MCTSLHFRHRLDEDPDDIEPFGVQRARLIEERTEGVR